MDRGRGAARGARAGAAADNGQSTGTRGARTASTTRGGLGVRRATAGPATARFRPKNIRRDEAERDSMARQEEKKDEAREAEERRATRGRGGFRSKRSRGDAMGARGSSTATGPFSSGIAEVSRRGGGGWFGSGGGGGSGSSGFRTTAAGSSSRRMKTESGRPGFSQGVDRNREGRINADKMHVLTPGEEIDSEDELMMSKLSSKPASSLPMGIYRQKHQDAEIVVATTAELEAAENATGEEESLWVGGDDTPEHIIPEQPPEEGVWDTGSSKRIRIKTEPEEEAMIDLDPMLPQSPEEKKKPAVEIKVKKPPPVDSEESRIQADLELLASELGTTTITEDGETRTEGPHDKDGRMYLFQFPPLLPPLKATTPASKPKIKDEAQDVNMMDAPPTDTRSAAAEKEVVIDDDQDDLENKKGFMSSLLSEGGMIGHLKVRKSGKVELDWGGRTLDLSPATSMNFLTTAVILEENDQKPAPDVIGGESIGMGKIMGRFVLAPSWDEEEDWEVSSEDLRL